MIILVQSSFHTTQANLIWNEARTNSLDWNGNELEHELELETMKRIYGNFVISIWKVDFYLISYSLLVTKIDVCPK